MYELVEYGRATWLGMPGGRGGAKSAAIQRIMLTRRLSHPGTVGAIVLRNNDQIMRYHVDPMLKTWPILRDYYQSTNKKLVLPLGRGTPSEIIFTYAESLDDVIRRFRSANFFDVFVDQSEQFTQNELFEIKQAVRWPGVPTGTCKLLLAFNLGGVGIDFLRRIFHLKTYGDNERPEDYAHVHVGPYDNIEWCRTALDEDGYLREHDPDNPRCECQECVFYGWSQDERMRYTAERSDYGRALVSQNPALVKRDWLGSWDSLEGSFFSHAYDRDSTVLSAEQVSKLIRPWWEKWLSQDWGRGHFCVTYWHARGEISPKDAEKILGWNIPRTLKVVVTYREYVAGGAAEEDGKVRELSEQDIARKIVELTPEDERKKMASFFLSPDAFAKRTSHNTIAQDQGAILAKAGLPYPRRADDDRVGGWALMSNMLLEAKRKGATWENVLLISAECAELIGALPLAMRDPKNLDDVLKTTKLSDDVIDACRYGLKSMLSPGQKPDEEVVREKVEAMAEAGLDENSIYIYRQRMMQELQQKHQPIVIGRGHKRPVMTPKRNF